jgi:hypothetical protein
MEILAASAKHWDCASVQGLLKLGQRGGGHLVSVLNSCPASNLPQQNLKNGFESGTETNALANQPDRRGRRLPHRVREASPRPIAGSVGSAHESAQNKQHNRRHFQALGDSTGRAGSTEASRPSSAMASPIGYLIHPDPPSAPNMAAPIHTASGFRSPLITTLNSGPTPAPPSLARPGPEQPTATPAAPGNHAKTSLYQCADCLRERCLQV